jgi:hypothetical protein
VAIIPTKFAQCFRGLHVPEEDAAVAAAGGKGRITGCDIEREDFVAVRRVGLNELRGFGRLMGSSGLGGSGARRIVQSDGAI